MPVRVTEQEKKIGRLNPKIYAGITFSSND